MATTTMQPFDVERLHTTPMGVERIRKNLALETDDVIGWCKAAVRDPAATAVRRGKNWYVTLGTAVLTVNAASLTVITAHRNKAMTTK